MSELQKGYLLIADISGYTVYLSESELDHAEKTLTALLELLIEHTRPPLVISRLEGDAVISYGLRDNFFKGQTFVEIIENTYVAFRKTIERLVLNTTCKCNACANISRLDLKFLFHYGSFAIQHIGGHAELVGSDVNLIHGLLKNNVREATGFQAYTLYTDAAIRQLKLEAISATMTPHTETVEHLGEVKVWVQDMHSVWEEKRSDTQVKIPPERIAGQLKTEIGMPPELVWDYLSQSELEFRNIWVGSDRQEIQNRTSGRVAPGSVYQCYHGDMVLLQTILEWQPFERMVIQQLTPFPNTSVLIEIQLVPTEKGTRLIQSASKAKGPLLGRLLFNMMMLMTAKGVEKRLEEFKRRIEDDLASNRGGLPFEAEISDEMFDERKRTPPE